MRLVDYRDHPMTSSSSSHKVVVLREGTSVSGGDPKKDYGYGWEEFVLSGRTEKMDYLFTAASQLGLDVGGSFIDHQSVDVGEEAVALRPVLYALCTDVAKDPRKVIIGGCDEEEETVDYVTDKWELPKDLWRDPRKGDARLEEIYVRRSERGVVFFSRTTGKRAAFACEGLEWKTDATPSPAKFPEFLDVSVTADTFADFDAAFAGFAREAWDGA